MKQFYNEKYLINFIRYGAIVVIILISYLITQIFISNTKQDLQEDLNLIEQTYIEKNKKAVKQLVLDINNFILVEKEFKQKALRKKLKEQIYQAHAIASAIYNKNKKHLDYSKEKTIEEIKTALRHIRFNDEMGYLFIYELKGKNILHAQHKSLEGKNLWNYKDSAGTLLLQKMNKILSIKDETFYNWYWKKPRSNNDQEKKLGFFKKFEPYGWFIGTGDYIKDYEANMKEEILKKLNNFTFQKPRHIFIYDLKGLCLVNPKKELVGLHRYNVQNKNGEYVVQNIINFVKKHKEGFIHYKGAVILNKMNKTNNKTSYIKLFEEWSWFIGSGFYLEELYKEFETRQNQLKESNKNALRKIILVSVFITLIMITISYFLSKAVDTVFKSYKFKIKEEMQQKVKKEKLLIQQSKMAIMGEMIGNIAHQWRQPLSVISMTNSLIRISLNKKSDLKPHKIISSLNDVENAVCYLNNTIDDFRNFFKPDKKKSLFKLKNLYEKTYKLISSQFKNNSIKIIKNIEEDAEVFGFENELLQVLINLIKNAKDELSNLNNNEEKLLFIDILKQNENVIIKIKDNAGGIDSKIIQKVFEPYFTTKDENEGTGVGLYMSKQIIEAMQGKLSVSNQEFIYKNKNYKGAEFKIVF